MSDSTSTEILPENQSKENKIKRWFPLESNPDVMNKFLGQMGFIIDQYCLTDVFSTEEWALGMVPKPVLGVLFLYPITENTEAYSKEEMVCYPYLILLYSILS